MKGEYEIATTRSSKNSMKSLNSVPNYIKRITSKSRQMSSKLTKDDWPKFSPIRTTPRGSKFRIGTRDSFVDVPNILIHYFIDQIYHIEKKSESSKEAYQKVKKELRRINGDLQASIENITGEKCDWIRIKVVKTPGCKKPYNIQVKKRWNRLLRFLNKIAQSDIPLSEKYTYIYKCRDFPLPPTKSKELDWISEENSDKVKELAEEDIKEPHKEIKSLSEKIENIAKICRNKWFFSSFYLYSKDFTSTLQHLKELINGGRITSCYRELRNSIEEFCESIFYDVLFINENKDFTEPIPPEMPTRNWFKEARNKSQLLKKLKDLRDRFSEAIDSIANLYENQFSRKDIWDCIFKNLNTSLFTAATSITDKVSPILSEERKEEIQKRAEKTLKKILSHLKDHESLTKEEKKLARGIARNLIPSSNSIYLKFPMGSLAKHFVSKRFSEDLRFEDYSYFSHAYPSSWQVAPNSSILEYKIFAEEFSKFSSKVKSILNSYRNLL